MAKEMVTSTRIAAAVGPFSPAVRDGEYLFLSGQVAQDPVTGRLVEGDLTAQVEQILHNLDAVLAAAGRTLDDVVRVGVYLIDMGDFQAVNTAYARHFERPFPARTTIAVAALPLGARVEMDAIAR